MRDCRGENRREDHWTEPARHGRTGVVLEKLTVKNFGCIKDVSVALAPIHAFIGPNDSGKSMLLRAVNEKGHGLPAVYDALMNRNDDAFRAIDIAEGTRRAIESFRVIGGVAHPRLEAWILALQGHPRSEERKHPENEVVEQGLARKNTAEFVAVVEAADLDALAADAHSLRAWVDSARRLLPDVVRDYTAVAPAAP